MDYFVTLHANYDKFWQTELLIQSFKMLGLQDRLLVAISGSNNIHELPPNLAAHPRKIYVVDYNAMYQHNHPPINKIAAIIAAQNQGLLDDTFVMMHSDMILVQPISENYKHNIVFHPNAPPKKCLEKIQTDLMWIGLDGVVRFHCVPPKFFEKALLQTEKLLKEHGTDWPATLAAWHFTTYEFAQLLTILGAYLEVGLNSTVMLPVIHYRDGFPPHFSKRSYGGVIRFSEEPMECLMRFNPTPNTDYIQHVIRSYKGRK